ncbi:MAG: outer membrane beta-barrel protein [Rickettsiales bacterium]|nr:outer membrane beta-barrel protein [Rickettsiales bacterium]
MHKKLVLTALIGGFVSTGAMADGFYIAPKLSLNTTSVDESRVETKVISGAWSEFTGNKQESWDGKKTQLSPKFSAGYQFDLQKYGLLSIEAEYGATKNHFNAANAMYDFAGATPNDSDTRDFAYNEKTISLNAIYGYQVKNVIPYVTAGIGYSTIESENNFRSGAYWWETRDQESNISWNIGAGVEVPVIDTVSLTFAYMYTDLGNVKYSNNMYHNKGTTEGIKRRFNSKVDLSKQEITAGLKIKF